MTTATAELSLTTCSYFQAFKAGLFPDPVETISEWSDKFMKIPSWSAEPGPWRTSRPPYLKEIMDCLSPTSPIRRVVFMKPAQVGGTSAGQNWIGYTIHRAPTTMLIVEPTVELSARLSEQRIQPMIEDCEVLKGRVKDARERDSGNKIRSKKFLGGMMVLTGANSGVGLRFMSAKNLMLDEVDGYPLSVGKEGAPVSVAEKRTITYAQFKIFLLSTPLLKHTSVIEPEFQASDMRRYTVPCPHCNSGLVLKWANLRWPKGKPEEAQYLCEHCGELIAEHYKTQMLEQGQWIAERRTTNPHPHSSRPRRSKNTTRRRWQS